MDLTELGKISRGLSDLPIAIAALVFAVLIMKNGKEDRKLWCTEFVLIGVGAIMGAVVHCYVRDETNLKIRWTILYAVMYALVWLFFVLMYEALEGNRPGKKWIAVTAIFYIASVTLRLMGSGADIYAFVIYAVFPAYVLVSLCIKEKNAEAVRERRVLILLVCAIASQALKSLVGSAGVVAAHLFIFVALLQLYFVAKDAGKEEE